MHKSTWSLPTHDQSFPTTSETAHEGQPLSISSPLTHPSRSVREHTRDVPTHPLFTVHKGRPSSTSDGLTPSSQPESNFHTMPQAYEDRIDPNTLSQGHESRSASTLSPSTPSSRPDFNIMPQTHTFTVNPNEGRALLSRGKGKHTCPHGRACNKGGIADDGSLLVFERNSAFRYVDLHPRHLLRLAD